MKRLSLSGFQLKYIALIAMVFDHIHYFFDYTGKIPIWFAMIGRLAAPLFLFSVIEGFIHTRNRKKYFLKIYVLAILMGLIQFGFYNFLHPLVRPDGFFPKNMMLSSFAILLVALQGIAWIQEKKYLKGIPTLLFPLMLPWLMLLLYLSGQDKPIFTLFINLLNYTVLPTHTSISDGGTWLLLTGIAMYLCHKNLKKEVLAFVSVSLVWVLMVIVLSRPSFHDLMFKYFEWMEIFAAPLMLCYNGQRGKGSKYLFYVFYPTHIYLLYALSVLLYR
ncbi:TraX family protein [Streptococcus sp.]|uniref:TraX family protein n=1 Tax=Streptococcus sp. TaxID=1306 RepID=UPI0029145EDA|nr:TraX family protein [Streptococcus sp.]MDU5555870.1 TraX family protein [Streptococcus sp.]